MKSQIVLSAQVTTTASTDEIDRTDSGVGAFYRPLSSAVNSLKSNARKDAKYRQTYICCAVCRPLEMYCTAQELTIASADINTPASGHSDLPTHPAPAADKHARMGDVAKQAKDGCLCCALLYQAYEKAYGAKSVFWYGVGGLVVRRRLSARDKTTLQFQSAGMYSLEIELFYEPGDIVLWPGIQTKPRRLRITDFDRCRIQIKAWMQTCENHHPNCGQGHNSQLPTRVIDVGTLDDTLVRLHQSHGIKTDSYIALSHCWGDATTVPQTRLNNIDQHRERIPEAKLSKTFEDAIEIARGLRVRYLWIDSLCIIQDCDEDWTREAARMGDVYSQALLTLAAVSSTDGNGGLFQEPDLREIRLHYGADNKYVCWLRLPFRDELYSTLHNTTNMACEYELPLLSRKWTFQERLLSRKTIYFGEEELAWECRTTTLCECGHKQTSQASHYHACGRKVKNEPSLKGAFTMVTTKSQRAWLPFDLVGYESSPTEACLIFWERIVKEYSLRKLTYSKDNLPALSGIAQACADLGLGEYHAGNWESSLPKALCWFQPNHMRKEPPRKPAEGHAPSWFWASSECAVDFAAFHAPVARVL